MAARAARRSLRCDAPAAAAGGGHRARAVVVGQPVGGRQRRSLAVAAAAQSARPGAAARAGPARALAVVGPGACRVRVDAHRAALVRRFRPAHHRHPARRAPLGRRRLGWRHGGEQLGADQPDRGLEPARRNRLDRRFASRPAHAVVGRCGADGGGAGQAGAGGPAAPGRPARHRLLHRLRPAVHAGGLFRAGAAARGDDGAGAARMIRLGTTLGLALLALSASAAPADDYATQWSLTLADPDAGAYAVVLDAAVYRQARSPALRDIDVLDAAGAPVPAQLMRTGDGGDANAVRVDLRWFALPAGENPDDGWSMAVDRAADGRILRVQAGTVAAPPGERPQAWLVDASTLDVRIEALHLAWAADNDGIDRAYRVEASDDLRQWRPVQSAAQLVDLSRDGERLLQQRVPVAASARYLRLLPAQGQGSPRLQSVRAELAPPDRRAPLQWRELAGSPVDER